MPSFPKSRRDQVEDGMAMALVREFSLTIYRCTNPDWEDRYLVWTVRKEVGDKYVEVMSRDLNYAIGECASLSAKS